MTPHPRKTTKKPAIFRVAVAFLTLDSVKNTDTAELLMQERRRLRSQLEHATEVSRKLVKGFNGIFFQAGTATTFHHLFAEIKAAIPFGLRMPVQEFETRFVPLRREINKGRDQNRPYHATICITLMGLTYVYPEWHFANDIATAITEARNIECKLEESTVRTDPTAKSKWIALQPEAIRQAALHRWCIIACFSLIEAYLSGLAWRFQQTEIKQLNALPTKDRKAIDDSGPPFKDRLVRIPRIIANNSLWDENDPDVITVLGLKQIRDALMHPSPFSQPEKFGGMNKLAIIYNLEHKEAEKCLNDTVVTLTRVFHHIHGMDAPLPEWLTHLTELSRGSKNCLNGHMLLFKAPCL